MINETIITLRKESHYGSTFYYVVDETKAQPIRMLTGRKTLTDTDMTALKMLGFTCRLQDEQLPV
jgi:hypothetical protein